MRLLLALGILGGVSWIAYAFVPEQCAPVTSDAEIFCNRLWTPTLFAMAAGMVGLVRFVAGLGSTRVTRWLSIGVLGFAFMTFGNFAEYWIFFGWPHDGPDGWLRSSLWSTVLIGWLALLLATFGAGLLLLLGRSTLGTRILGAILVTAPCLTVFIGPLALGVLSIGACLYAFVAKASVPPEPVTEPA